MQLPAKKVSHHYARRFRHLLAVLPFVFWPAVAVVQGQSVRVRLTVDAQSPAKLTIEAEGPLTDSWSFRNVYGAIVGLGERIEEFQATDADGQIVPVRKLAAGEIRATRKTTRFSYQVRVTEPSRPGDMSHVSWLNPEYGLLMLADLLPQSTSQVGAPIFLSVQLNLPAGWRAVSSVKPVNGQTYLISDSDGAVFFVGRGLREKTVRRPAMELALVTVGEWPFHDGEALKIAGKIIDEYTKITRHRVQARSVLMLVPFSAPFGADRWTAETRDSTVTLVLGRKAGREALLGRLSVVLTHELFHLWVPKGLALDGDYDWFFEGFTLYQALLTARRLRIITFNEYLDTLGRVYDSYRSLPEHDKLSLVEASERRWTSPSSLVYDKGMLVAFLYDLFLRRASGTRASVTDVYPQLFQLPRTTGATANELICLILDRPEGMNKFTETFVRKAGGIELGELLAPYGIRVDVLGTRTRLVVEKDLTKEQRRLLGSLGYKE